MEITQDMVKLRERLLSLHARATAEKIMIERISGNENRYQELLDELFEIINSIHSNTDDQFECPCPRCSNVGKDKPMD